MESYSPLVPISIIKTIKATARKIPTATPSLKIIIRIPKSLESKIITEKLKTSKMRKSGRPAPGFFLLILKN
jgi:hypothetical protein